VRRETSFFVESSRRSARFELWNRFIFRNGGGARAFFLRGQKAMESVMPVLLWAVPAVIFIGGVGYFLVHTVH
jgi:hypothetical protein